MDEATQELVINQLRLAGAGMVMERVLYALMTAHPDYGALFQVLQAELDSSKAAHIPPGAILDSWHSTAARFLEHSVTLLAQSQAGSATKN
jgi:hypothetical protein